ncbi:MAG TPA: nitrous oxide reductase accessory protein NosL, partial [Puia sp.]|nr:nitrous oxide reductase accessory protein NosL [Puia sp.]
QIELTAPQYPEGLVLQIYANRIGGAVDVINGLNHYIGMATLHTRDFVEFVALPYIIGGFLVIGFLVVLVNRQWLFYAWYFLFLLIAFTSMIDFYRWEYNYGHNLDPNAPIKVPGMVYQPPLIGYKQLLNFTAYSIPDSGGWIFVGVGVLLTVALVLELLRLKKNRKHKFYHAAAILVIIGTLFISGCSSGPAPIQYGRDNCDFCKMGFEDKRSGAELITDKGKQYKFDDVHCLLGFLKENGVKRETVKDIYFVDFTDEHDFVNAENALLLKSDSLHTPMNGNVVAFKNADSAKKYQQDLNGQLIKWEDLYKY